MAYLSSKNVAYIFWHTSAHAKETVHVDSPNTFNAIDTTYAAVDRWHKENGWKGFGYHGLIRMDGSYQQGRKLNETGAQVYGLNSKSWGLCFSGHGDYQNFTLAQYVTGIQKTREMQRMVVNDCGAVPRLLGHGPGVRTLYKEGVLTRRFWTSKSCPGNLVKMDIVRQVMDELPNLHIELSKDEVTKAAQKILLMSLA